MGGGWGRGTREKYLEVVMNMVEASGLEGWMRLMVMNVEGGR